MSVVSLDVQQMTIAIRDGTSVRQATTTRLLVDIASTQNFR